MNALVALGDCDIGSNIAGMAVSVKDWYLPDSTTPTISMSGP